VSRRPLKTLIIGVGNPLAGDDGIGPTVAARLCKRSGAGTEGRAFAGSALDLLGLIDQAGAPDRVVIVDSLVGDALDEGEVARVAFPDDPAGPWISSHHVGVLELKALAERLRVRLPDDLRLYGIGVCEEAVFREGLSERLARRVPNMVRHIQDDLGGAPA
jgi:hydrogenase maturation protease